MLMLGSLKDRAAANVGPPIPTYPANTIFSQRAWGVSHLFEHQPRIQKGRLHDWQYSGQWRPTVQHEARDASPMGPIPALEPRPRRVTQKGSDTSGFVEHPASWLITVRPTPSSSSSPNAGRSRLSLGRTPGRAET